MRFRALLVALLTVAASAVAVTAHAATPGPYFGPLALLEISVAGHNAALGIDENAGHTGLIGSLGASAGTSAYLLVQECSVAETACTSIPSSARSYPTASHEVELTTADVTAVPGHTYRTCAFVTFSGQSGGGCTAPVFPGGQAFVGYVWQYLQPGTGRTTGWLNVHVLNGQMESVLMDLWICDGRGNRCSVASTSTVRSVLPPHPNWGASMPPVTATHGHTYKTCALMSVQGLTSGACTPLAAF